MSRVRHYLASSKKPMQFSKKQCIYADLLVLLVLLLDFALKWHGHEGMSDVAIAVVSTFGGFVTGGYFALSGVRDCSLNKHKAQAKTEI